MPLAANPLTSGLVALGQASTPLQAARAALLLWLGGSAGARRPGALESSCARSFADDGFVSPPGRVGAPPYPGFGLGLGRVSEVEVLQE